MAKITEKIMKMNFKKKLKQLIIAALCVAVLGGGLSGFLLREQIGQVITGVQEWHQEDEDRSYGWESEDLYDYGALKHYYQRGNYFYDRLQITEPSMAAKVTAGITGLLCGILAFVFWVLIALWLYQAAVRSGMNGVFWLFAGLGGNLFAAALFILVRSFIRKNKRCAFDTDRKGPFSCSV